MPHLTMCNVNYCSAHQILKETENAQQNFERQKENKLIGLNEKKNMQDRMFCYKISSDPIRSTKLPPTDSKPRKICLSQTRISQETRSPYPAPYEILDTNVVTTTIKMYIKNINIHNNNVKQF